MDNSWRCESCLVVNSTNAEECECCMQKRGSTEATGNATNDNKDSNENAQDTKINESEQKPKITTGEGGGFMPSVESTNNKNEAESKSVFLTGADNNKSVKNEEDGSEDKQKNNANKSKERKRGEKRERQSSSRIQPSRRCTQKKICYKT
ncbi:conserved Plasmodium protein, unknown function [Plasmodium vinckei vinckei]|uniref:RanBP2-type domain-containing protein n=1 Tax=Plasmodium vinckei vinckei TaxID=54757 RepID=A0A449BZR2_PLAVN|nr:conserved Plasmodium protein, unknown function [Plasmodium vinckei vinckei]KEG04265.1 hypothetical protein YYE_01171 [Plasmodium vinckei vinckei]VEV58934.1 conserved Plasmodium protein, unknown function [Plasmodium vinckei vinckei]